MQIMYVPSIGNPKRYSIQIHIQISKRTRNYKIENSKFNYYYCYYTLILSTNSIWENVVTLIFLFQLRANISIVQFMHYINLVYHLNTSLAGNSESHLSEFQDMLYQIRPFLHAN